MSLYVAEEGSGEETIVFLHGLGVSGWMWADQIAALREEWHCLNVDLPGNGESHSQEWKSLDAAADAVATVVRERAVGGRAHVVGLSLGGYVGLHLLARHPEIVRSLLVSGVTAVPFRPWPLWWLLTRGIAVVSGFGAVARLSAKAMQLPDEVVPLYLRDARRLESRTVRRVYDEVLQFRPPAPLRRNVRPVLVVAGGAEAASVRRSLPEHERVIAGAVSALVPEVHHAWNAERPELFTSMIRSWARSGELPEEMGAGPDAAA